MKRVRLNRAYGRYFAGDVAGFSDDEAAYIIGKMAGVWLDGPAAVDEIDTRTHDLTVGGVRELVGDTEDMSALSALRAGELSHPKHEGGRHGALEAIDDRIAQLEGAE